ncbi:YciI family protein [Kerstersia gyiorum]|uniref:GTP cyclohydrolase n=1 Tax=Kerstersia gyiorum TaxID=206506 RepID=A0A171KNV8_9BURK|nr:YciI family protein [Kerstersia gyiorum]KAB0541808.1 GTP cyclohydrolase [Kerstersia gyiorum]KKO70575.1 GTP cyclohydrolase [Kerstersia gyiorum]RZS63881.1 uncharacterized protein YciI [Kerstersia gyiorum]
MYVIELTYQKPLEAIEAQLEAHRRYLDLQYERGVFLASGPKNPRDGGIILATGKLARAELDDLLLQDPFQQHGLASYRVIEFSPVKFHPVLNSVL